MVDKVFVDVEFSSEICDSAFVELADNLNGFSETLSSDNIGVTGVCRPRICFSRASPGGVLEFDFIRRPEGDVKSIEGEGEICVVVGLSTL